MTSFEYRTITTDGPIKEFKLFRMARGGWALALKEQPRSNIYIYNFRRLRAPVEVRANRAI
jgi:hypothetical protein